MQVAKHEWKQSWANYLASSRGWIVAQIDGRGSGGEGDRRRFEIWHQLGSVEVADQVYFNVANFLLLSLRIQAGLSPSTECKKRVPNFKT